MKYKKSFGMHENIVGALCYLFFWITGIFFLLKEKENKFIRFHALQSVLLFIPLSIIVFLSGWIPYYGWMIADFLGFMSIFILIICVFLAYRGLKFKIPIIGKIAYNTVYINNE